MAKMFLTDEPVLDENIQALDSVKAFEWLLNAFRKSNGNEFVWSEIRNILYNATLLSEKFCHEKAPTALGCLDTEAELKTILKGTYGGPSLSYEEGKFVIYYWYDAPVHEEISGEGVTLKEAIANHKTKEEREKAKKLSEEKKIKKKKTKKKKKLW